MHEKDLAKDVAEDVLGAAKDGNVKFLIMKVFIFDRPPGGTPIYVAGV